MTHEEYAEHVKAFTAEMAAVTSQKNPDYSAGQDDAMANYRECASAADITPIQAWSVLAMKHWTAICRYIKTGRVTSEPIHGRFIDMANYMMLGDALVNDLEGLNNENVSGGRADEQNIAKN